MKLSVLDQSPAAQGHAQDVAIRESLALAKACAVHPTKYRARLRSNDRTMRIAMPEEVQHRRRPDLPDGLAVPRPAMSGA